MNIVTAEDVLKRWREADREDAPDADNEQLLTFIEDAQVIITLAHPHVPLRIDAGTMLPGVVKIVVADMVQRAFLRSHDGRVSYGSTTGPFSESGAYTDTNASLYLNARENIMLANPAAASGKAYSVNMDSRRGGRFTNGRAGVYNGYSYLGGGSVQDDEH